MLVHLKGELKQLLRLLSGRLRRQMSLDEFFVELERAIQHNSLQRSWTLEDGKIRLARRLTKSVGVDFTPLTLVAYCMSRKKHLLFPPQIQEEAGRYLRLSKDDAHNIALASDYSPEKERILGSFLHAVQHLHPEKGERMLQHLQELRQRLLAATHIHEESRQVS